MADSKNNDTYNILKNFTDHKEDTDRELVKIESRLQDRIIEVKSDLKGDIIQIKTDLKDDIKEIRNTLRTITNLIITCGVGILAVIVTLILNIILK